MNARLAAAVATCLAVPALRFNQREHLPCTRSARLELDCLLCRLHGFIVAAEGSQQSGEIEVCVDAQRFKPNCLLQKLDRFLDLAEIPDDRGEPDLRLRGSRSELGGPAIFSLGPF